jgi:hypothetical protein
MLSKDPKLNNPPDVCQGVCEVTSRKDCWSLVDYFHANDAIFFELSTSCLPKQKYSDLYDPNSLLNFRSCPGTICPVCTLAELLDLQKNSVFCPRQRSEVYQDMTRPLSEYFISSSHNTYCGGNQFFGDASLKQIAKTLQSGARVIELDCFDGLMGQGPIVKHGWTPMIPVSFERALIEIRKNAFVKTSYPLILTLENHCNRENQGLQARLLRIVFGNLLYIHESPRHHDSAEAESAFLSPADLKGKIVLRHKSRILSNSQAKYDCGNGCEDINLESVKTKKSMGKPRISRSEGNYVWLQCMPWRKEQRERMKATTCELAQLVYIRNTSVKEHTIEQFSKSPSPISCSWDEVKLHTNFQVPSARHKILKYTSKQIMRVYPAFWRFNSSNFGPQEAWCTGVQMVAMNWQTYDRHMAFNIARFADNGGCGYVLKPAWINNVGVEFDENPELLHVTVYACWLPQLVANSAFVTSLRRHNLFSSSQTDEEYLVLTLNWDRICPKSGLRSKASTSTPPVWSKASARCHSSNLPKIDSCTNCWSSSSKHLRNTQHCLNPSSYDPSLICGRTSTFINYDKAAWIWPSPPQFSCIVNRNGNDLALLRFEVTRCGHRRQRLSSSLFGEYTIAVRNIREGYRVVPLVNPDTGIILEKSFVFARFQYKRGEHKCS